MKGKLDNKVVVVAGGGGIGDELARHYVAEGASVVLGDLNGEAAKAVAKDIDSTGKRAIGVELDGGDDKSVQAIVNLAVASFGRLDGFHANFADFSDGVLQQGATDMPLDVYDQMMRVNARGFLLCTRHAVPAMIATGGGSMVYTSSGSASIGEPVRVAYAMSKAAIHALMRHVARRYGPQGIRANVIAPGMILHPKLEKALGEQGVKMSLERTAIKSRLGVPADIAAVGALLISDNGGFISGQIISVDGGATMRT